MWLDPKRLCAQASAARTTRWGVGSVRGDPGPGGSEHLTGSTFHLCAGDACGLPDGVDNGDVVLCGEAGQRVLVFSCHHGFELQGPEQVACSPRGGAVRAPVCRGQWPPGRALLTSPPNRRSSDGR